MSRTDFIVQQVVVGAIAMLLVGGTMMLLVLRISVPEFLVGFDGVIVTAAFANGGFFAVARSAQPTAELARLAMEQHHELASAGIQAVSQSVTSGNASTGSTSK